MHRLMTEKQRGFSCGLLLLLCLTTLSHCFFVAVTVTYLVKWVDEELDLIQGINTSTLPTFVLTVGQYSPC